MSDYWPHLLAAVLMVVLATATAVHILLRKEETRAAVGWLGLVWFSPFLGVVLYWLFGVNRIRRRARLLLADKTPPVHTPTGAEVAPDDLASLLPPEADRLTQLALLTDRLSRLPLLRGNAVEPLIDGDEAYPAMLAAIRGAERSVGLSTYIFDNDRWGRHFLGALRDAVGRGVAVRVLVDSVGARYSRPPITRALRGDGVPVARFMQARLPWQFRYFNLRLHRKLLVVDGATGFTGGMNISAGNALADRPRRPIRDVHFRVRGPVVAELQRVFADDWKFTTGEALLGEGWFPRLDPAGGAVARGIADGPDEDFDKLRLTLLGALACAKESIRVATPYFLPDGEVAAGLKIAALRGVRVEVLLPARGNLAIVQWASTAGLGGLLSAGCRIFLSPPPFDHAKLLTVDGVWSLIGSANWDPRSLALNFEFDLECYDRSLAAVLEGVFEARRAASRELREQELLERPLAAVLRDRLFRLFAPYL